MLPDWKLLAARLAVTTYIMHQNQCLATMSMFSCKLCTAATAAPRVVESNYHANFTIA
jgi:hypothetical protein